MVDESGDRLLGVELIFVDGDLGSLREEINQNILRAGLPGKDFLHFRAATFWTHHVGHAELDGWSTGFVERCRSDGGRVDPR